MLFLICHSVVALPVAIRVCSFIIPASSALFMVLCSLQDLLW